MKWDELDELSKRFCYESYCADIWYEHGDDAPRMSFAEWCEESKKLGEPVGVCL